jgi:hypothetical protein
MSFAGFVQQYIKPSRWWRRHKSIEVTIWPRFLAQALCPHIHANPFMWDIENNTRTMQCIDCHKRFTEATNCAHGEVEVSMHELVEGKMIPYTFHCTHCGMPLDKTEVPKGAVITAPNLGNAAQQSAARDH